jgi:hypothetical protein
MAPSAPLFKERPFIVRVVVGVEGFGKILQIRYIGLLLGPQPDKNPCNNAANQLEDFPDRYPVRFQQANRGQERIIV